MKKNQNKSKFEERKSVANQCDYSRSNGKSRSSSLYTL